jgi:hypothetical protein
MSKEINKEDIKSEALSLGRAHVEELGRFSNEKMGAIEPVEPKELEAFFDEEDMVPLKEIKRKTTKIEYLQKLNEAMDLILYKNMGRAEFRKVYAREYGVSEYTADKVYAKVKLIVKNRFEAKRDQLIAEHLTRYFDLLDRARDDGNKRVERETLFDIARIMGLDQAKLDISSGGEPISIKINLSNNPNDFKQE